MINKVIIVEYYLHTYVHWQTTGNVQINFERKTQIGDERNKSLYHVYKKGRWKRPFCIWYFSMILRTIIIKIRKILVYPIQGSFLCEQQRQKLAVGNFLYAIYYLQGLKKAVRLSHQSKTV